MKEIDANTYSGALALRALYVIAHAIIRADGVAADSEKRMLVQIVRDILGNPDFSEEFIIWQMHEHADRSLLAEPVADLSFEYRATLLKCAYFIANSDGNIVIEEWDLLKDLAKALGMPDDWQKFFMPKSNEQAGGKMLAGDSSNSLMTWARGIIGVEAQADREMVAKAVNSQLEECDTSTNDGQEKYKALHDAAAVLLGGSPPAEGEDKSDLPIGF